eukprot:1532145-Amphidinium_carterae.2
MQLQLAQLVCDGRPLTVREVLLHGYGGVCVVKNKEDLLRLARLHKGDAAKTPQVAVAATAKEARQKAKDELKVQQVTRIDTWKTLLKALPLPADTEQEESTEQPSTEVPWSAWDCSAIQEQESGSTPHSLEDEWCEDDDFMESDWAKEEEQGDRFETRKRRVTEQGDAEPTQVADLKKENVQLRKQLELLTSTLAELKDEIVRLRESQGAPMRQVMRTRYVPEEVAPMDDGETVVESLREDKKQSLTWRPRRSTRSEEKQQVRGRYSSFCQGGPVGGTAILKMTKHPDQAKSALILKQEVCEWGILHATQVEQQLECLPNTLLSDIRTAQRRVVIASEKCFALASLYFDLKLLIVYENSAIRWGLLPLQHGEDSMHFWPLWCKDNHFAYGTHLVDC